MIEEYKESVLHELEKATDDSDVEQVIIRSVDRFPEGDLYKHLVVIYLHILQSGLERFPKEDNNFVKKHNIHHAIEYLKQVNEDREKTE